MIDYLLDVKPLEDSGVDDSAIALHLAARTADPIPCSTARILLQESGAVVEDPVAGTRAGSLIDYYSGLPQGDAKSLLSWFISHCFGSGDMVSTNEYPRSVQWTTVTSGMGPDLQVVVDQLVKAGGGQPDADVSVDDVIAAREKHNAIVADEQRMQGIDQLRAEIENTWINPAISDGASTESDVRAAIKAGL